MDDDDAYQYPVDDVPWGSLWPEPDPAHGDGSDYAESAHNDGTPGAVPDGRAA